MYKTRRPREGNKAHIINKGLLKIPKTYRKIIKMLLVVHKNDHNLG